MLLLRDLRIGRRDTYRHIIFARGYLVLLFDSDSRYREKRAIWRLLELAPLRRGMADGRIYRWYAANIPMNLVPNSGFVGDIDLLLCLREGRGLGATLIYKTWEVKVALADKMGRPRSLKTGKIRDVVKQLNLYRRFQFVLQ
jgi:hypothetical protein